MGAAQIEELTCEITYLFYRSVQFLSQGLSGNRRMGHFGVRVNLTFFWARKDDFTAKTQFMWKEIFVRLYNCFL